MLVSEPASRDRAVRLHLDCAPLSLDPALATDYSAVVVLQALCEPLFRIGRKGIELAAAAEVSHNDTGTEWLIELRRDLRWSDGRPITAHDFVRAFYAAAAHGASPLARVVTGAFSAGERVDGTRVFRAEDQLRIAVKLGHPVPWVPALLTSTALAPRPARSPGSERWPWSGPYCLESRASDRMRLVGNPHWRGGDAVRPPLDFTISQELHAPLGQFAAGELDVTCSTFFPVDQRANWASSDEFHEHESSIGFGVHVQPSLLEADDLCEMRRALSMAVSSRALAERVGYAIEPWRHFVPSFLAGQEFGDDGDVDGFDPAAAADTLPAAARELGALPLLFPDYYPNGAVAAELAGEWRAVLDLDIRPVPVDLADYVSRFEQGDFTLALGLSSPVVPDAFATLSMTLGAADEAQIAAANAELERGGEEGELLRRLDRILHLNPPFIPIGQLRHRWLQSRRIAGYELSASALDVAGLRWC